MCCCLLGYGTVGEPERLKAMKSLNMFTDREGLVHDTALVMCNETLMPVSKMQVIISKLTSRVKRKLIILDTRVSSAPLKSASTNSSPEELLQKTLMRAQSTYSTISGKRLCILLFDEDDIGVVFQNCFL